MSEFLLSNHLPQTSSEIKNNSRSVFFPIGTKDRSDVFDWNAVAGRVIKLAYRKTLNKSTLEDFELACKDTFQAKLDEPDFWHVVKDMYFTDGTLSNISPEFLLFNAHKQKGSSPNERLGDMFSSMLGESFLILEKPPELALNFFEQEIYNVLETFLASTDSRTNKKSEQYLPFLSQCFQDDLKFLVKRPKYLLSVLKEFLKLYSHLYTAQLALNLNDWASGEPTAKPHYFILDSEKASDERYLVKRHGYNQLMHHLEAVFPYLSMNEALQAGNERTHPIWKLAASLAHFPSVNDKLKTFAKAFKEERKLKTDLADGNNGEILDNLLRLSKEQFSRSETRHDINQKYIKATESELCAHFIQTRGRAGRVLVFNQDYLLLLTNLAIGELPKLRLQELIEAFKVRGVFFDKQSKQVLIEFYERIGNVERMSDSGDAVYVRKTV